MKIHQTFICKNLFSHILHIYFYKKASDPTLFLFVFLIKSQQSIIISDYFNEKSLVLFLFSELQFSKKAVTFPCFF